MASKAIYQPIHKSVGIVKPGIFSDLYKIKDSKTKTLDNSPSSIIETRDSNISQ